MRDEQVETITRGADQAEFIRQFVVGRTPKQLDEAKLYCPCWQCKKKREWRDRGGGKRRSTRRHTERKADG